MRVTSLLTLVSTFALLAAAARPAGMVRRQSNAMDVPLSLDELVAKFDSLTAEQQDEAVKKLSPKEILRLKNCLYFKEIPEVLKPTCPDNLTSVAELADVLHLFDAHNLFEKAPQVGGKREGQPLLFSWAYFGSAVVFDLYERIWARRFGRQLVGCGVDVEFKNKGMRKEVEVRTFSGNVGIHVF
ncbi:hypothetical protein BDV33DRAFT_190103 [Aspergillus novoparasiticus]|uniref:Uncharacterized protein n=1 Tax=Aspergillus novoparasiticus TaxID=986946 RepID=A0A5N6EWV6_9EURO|nr:hypothetical protein BDV33DRAFT_190103 [Aspergillus novoparasiticus]